MVVLIGLLLATNKPAMETSLPTTDSPHTGGHSGLPLALKITLGIGIPSLIIAFLSCLPAYIRAIKKFKCCQKGKKREGEDSENTQTDTDSEMNAERDTLLQGSETICQPQMESTNQTEMSNQNLPKDVTAAMETTDGPTTNARNATTCSTQKDIYKNDVFLVSSKKKSAEVTKIMNIIKKNQWTYTTLDDRKLGEPKLHDAGDAVESSSNILVLYTSNEDYDRLSKMIIEMSFEAERRIIPISCCEENLSLPLRSMNNLSIDDEDLERRLKDCIDTTMRERSEDSSSTNSAASDGTNRGEGEPSASAAASDVTNRGEGEPSASAGSYWPEQRDCGLGYKLGEKQKE